MTFRDNLTNLSLRCLIHEVAKWVIIYPFVCYSLTWSLSVMQQSKPLLGENEEKKSLFMTEKKFPITRSQNDSWNLWSTTDRPWGKKSEWKEKVTTKQELLWLVRSQLAPIFYHKIQPIRFVKTIQSTLYSVWVMGCGVTGLWCMVY